MKLTKKMLIVGLATTMASTNVLAESAFYKVSGNSMNKTLKDGEVVKVVSTEYKDGDNVVAKTKSGEYIIKELQGKQLVGKSTDGKSLAFNVDDVEILGKADKVTDVDGQGLELQSALAYEYTSPIAKAYAGNATAMFLHEDTSLSGFGKNVENFFGSHTASLTKISDPTGYSHIKVATGGTDFRNDTFYGFKPDPNGSGLYNIYQIRKGTFSTHTHMSGTSANTMVKDYIYAYPGHDQLFVKVDADGVPLAQGHEQHGYFTGTGIGHPYNKDWTAGFRNVLATDGERKVFGGDIDGWRHLDKTLTASFTTPDFTIDPSAPNWGIRVYNMSYNGTGFNDATFTMDVLKVNTDGTTTKIATFNRPWDRNHIYYTDNGTKAIDNNPGTYRLVINSTNLSYKVQIETRHWFPNKVVRVEGMTHYSGHYAIMDEFGDIYVQRSYGRVRKAVFPNNSDGTPVKIVPDSLKGGLTKIGGIDLEGRLWWWNVETSPQMIPFPANEDGSAFYTKHYVEEFSIGEEFILIKVRNRTTDETTVWAYGNNSHGQIPVLPAGTNPSTAVRIDRVGSPLTNIQSVAAGRDFSIIVQNTSDGQLVWTSGSNDYGQLGGGTSLTNPEPFIVPGLKNVKYISETIDNHNTGYVLPYDTVVSTDTELFKIGRTVSYANVGTLGNARSVDKFIKSEQQGFYIEKGNRMVYGSGNDWRCGTGGIGSWAHKPIIADVNFRASHNNGNTNFINVKDVGSGYWGGQIVDANGLLWSWGHHNYAAQGLTMRSDGVYQWTCHAKPALLNGDDPTSIVPAIFEQVGGRDSVPVALDNTGKLWRIDDNVSPLLATNHPAYNTKFVDVTYGFSHVGLIDDQGRLWMYGEGANGRLGLNNQNDYWESPQLVNPTYYNNEKVVHVATLVNHTLFVTESGSVYSMGYNEFGQLGTGDYEQVLIPTKVLNVKDIKMVGGGDRHSLALDKDGRVWAWGYAGAGALGDNFSMQREKASTAVGNDLPIMSILNDIETTYLSQNGNKNIRLHGKIREPEGEETQITTTVLGVDKEHTITADSWNRDIYDKVEEKEWFIDLNLSEIPAEQTFQSLTKITATDARGGLIEQFFAGHFVVDSEIPNLPTWGETCILDPNTLTETTCYVNQYFFANGNNGVNAPVRMYINAPQKNKDNAAPVFPQISYRKKQAYGYPPSWTEWEDVLNKNDKGYYIDFFQGFQGETQFKIRSKDKALNLSPSSNEYRYTIISNAGAEINNVKTDALITDNVLSNQLIFDAKTPVGSGLKTYDVKTRIKAKEGEVENPWIDLTPGRATWSGSEITFTDNSEGLLGNEKYEYKIDAENSVAIGIPKVVEVISNPYMAENIAVYPKDDGMLVMVTQDKRNKGTTLYRIVIVDNLTGEVYSEDKTSNNINESVNFDLKDAKIPFNIVNNSVQIKLVIKGENGKYHTMTYSENFTNSPALLNDKEAPKIVLSIPEKYQTIVNNGGNNPIDINVFGTDNITLPENLQVQISRDGANWYGYDASRKMWLQNTWGAYRSVYTGYEMGSESGKKLIYFKVRDGAGNVAYENISVNIIEPLKKDETSGGASKDNSGVVNDSDFTPTNDLHTNSPNVKINIPKTGNATEVQFSFDGVAWSPWEKISSSFTKYIAFPYGEGKKIIFVRYKNDYGSVSDLNPTNDIVKYTFDEEEPTLQVKTANGTYITKSVGIRLAMIGKDNLSKEVKIQLEGSNYTLHQVYSNGTVNPSPYANNTTVVNAGEKVYLEVLGLNTVGFHELNFKITDKAGNTTNETVRIYKK